MLKKVVHNYPVENLKEKQFLKLLIETTEFKGTIVNLSSRCLCVQVVSEHFSYRACSACIPGFGILDSTIFADEKGITERGLAVAFCVLEATAHVMLYFEKNRSEIVHVYREFCQIIDLEMPPSEIPSETELQAEKTRFRKLFKANAIRQNEYMAELKKLRSYSQKRFHRYFELNCAMREYLQSKTGYHICSELCDEIIKGLAQ